MFPFGGELVSSQFCYTITREEIFYFVTKNMPYLCGLWRFANAYKYQISKGVMTMTELERWLKKYGKAKTVATGKQGNVNNKTTNNNVNTTKKKDVNALIKEEMDKLISHLHQKIDEKKYKYYKIKK